MLRAVLETVLTEGDADTVFVDGLGIFVVSPSMKNWRSDHEELPQVPIDVKKRLGKPIVMVLPVEATGPDAIEFESDRRNICDYYLGEGLPVYLTLDRAAKALANLLGYYERRDAISSSDSSS